MRQGIDDSAALDAFMGTYRHEAVKQLVKAEESFVSTALLGIGDQSPSRSFRAGASNHLFCSFGGAWAHRGPCPLRPELPPVALSSGDGPTAEGCRRGRPRSFHSAPSSNPAPETGATRSWL